MVGDGVFFCRALSLMSPPVSADCPGQALSRFAIPSLFCKALVFVLSPVCVSNLIALSCMSITSQTLWSLSLLPIPLNFTTDFLKCIILFQGVFLDFTI